MEKLLCPSMMCADFNNLKKEVVKKIEDESVKNYLSEEIEKDTFLYPILQWD